jgi:UDP-N-acetylglucosamine 1-carboxyvinyltransferase
MVRPESITARGGRELHGVVPIGGYKHALTVIVAAAVALRRQVTLRNVPMTTESLVLERILREMGAGSRFADDVWDLDTRPMRNVPVPADLSKLVHGSLYLAPALLARFGEVSLAGAGGDRIGPPELDCQRPAAQIGAVMERFGATLSAGDCISARASSLRGCAIDVLEFSSDARRLRGPATSSATKTALLLAAASDGETTISHPVDRDATWELCDFLRACGVSVTHDDGAWRVRGSAHAGRVEHDLISDSTEIMTFAVAAAHVGGSLRLTGITGPRTWRAIADELRLLQDAGVPIRRGEDWLEVAGAGPIRPVDLEIDCNGFSTDAHPFVTLLMLGAEGESRITDHVWSSRFAYVDLLRAMRGRLRVANGSVHVIPSRLHPPDDVLAPTDSRAAAVALLAALGTPGTTRILDAGHIARSYQDLVPKLRAVGAQVEVCSAPAGR